MSKYTFNTMKVIILFIVLCIVCFFTVAQGSNETAKLNEAQELFKKQRFQESIVICDTVLQNN